MMDIQQYTSGPLTYYQNSSRPSVLILSGMHGCEPSGPRGLLAYLDALLNASTPFGVSVERERILRAITLHVIPLLNPGGALRFSQHFPDSWHGTWIPEWTEPNKLPWKVKIILRWGTENTQSFQSSAADQGLTNEVGLVAGTVKAIWQTPVQNRPAQPGVIQP